MYYPFFVYGTLKTGGSNYTNYLAGHTISEDEAYLEHAALYDAGPYPFLVLDADRSSGQQVRGQLMLVKPDEYDAVLEHVDSLEGYLEGSDTNMYERLLVDVYGPDGIQQAWVYIAAAPTVADIHAGRLSKIADGNWPIAPLASGV